MRSPAEMDTIQIDITNACDRRCSNCTRFCGNHKRPFFMDYETFVRAVDSLDGFDGVTGVMGGEPTMHPEFERFSLFLQRKFGLVSENRLMKPQQGFIKEIRRREFESHVLRTAPDRRRILKRHGPGLWSNMGSSYYRRYELISDTFPVQFVNDHINPSYHQPGLFSRADLGIPDEVWFRLRDACWIQNVWSAAITPKGAFFCEIAAALDMLFNGPGGWKIEPGWWKRRPEEFGEQLRWCEYCGFALDTFMRNAEDEKDDVSPTLYRMLQEIDSPGLKRGRTQLVEIVDGQIRNRPAIPQMHLTMTAPYLEHYDDRFNASNSALFSHSFRSAAIPTGTGFGRSLNTELKQTDGWLLLCDTAVGLPEAGEAVRKLMRRHILNPGALHIGNGYCLLHRDALSLRRIGFDRIAGFLSREDLSESWQTEKRVSLEKLSAAAPLRRSRVQHNQRYALWGTGLAGSTLLDLAREAGGEAVYAVDVDTEKQGGSFYGLSVYPPRYLAEHPDSFDLLLLGHYTRFDDIAAEARALRVPEEKLVFPYEV